MTGRQNLRRAVAVAVLGLLGMLLLIGFLGEAELRPTPTDTLPVDADSTRVVELQSEFDRADESVAVVLYSRDDGELDRAAVRELERSFADATGSRAPAAGQRGPHRRDRRRARRGHRAPRPSRTVWGSCGRTWPPTCRTGSMAQVTGPAAIQADLSAVFDGANTRLLLATASVVAVLLILTYRSPVLWIVPLAVVGIADRLAAVLATQVMDVAGVVWDESTIGILSVLVFGAGTDYALLLISRYRDELKVHDDRYDAMRRAWRRTAEAVLSSSATVVVGVLTLLLCSFPTTRGLGVASAVGIVVAAAAVLVVLPAALVLCGRWVFWPLVPRVGQTTLVDGTSFWGRIGRRVARTPVTLIACATVLLGGMALGLTQVETGLSTSEQFLDEPEAISAAERLAESFPAGASDPTVVVTPRGPAAGRLGPRPTSTTWSPARSPTAPTAGAGSTWCSRARRAATPPRPRSATCAPRSTTSPRPTSAAPRRSPSTRPTPPPATAGS